MICPACREPLLLLTTPLTSTMTEVDGQVTVQLSQRGQIVHEWSRKPNCAHRSWL